MSDQNQIILSKPLMDENIGTKKEDMVTISDNSNKRKFSERTANKRKKLNICNLKSKIKDEAFSQTYEDDHENNSITDLKESDSSLQDKLHNQNRLMSYEEKSILPVSKTLL